MFYPPSLLPGHGSGLGFLCLPFVLVRCWLGTYTVQLFLHTHTVISTHAGVKEADVWFVGIAAVSLRLCREACRLDAEGLPKLSLKSNTLN